MRHPALDRLLEVAAGRFPPVDGVVEFHGPTRPGVGAVLSFTGHALVLTDLEDRSTLPPESNDAFGGVLSPESLRALAGADGIVHVVDATLVAHGTGEGRLPPRPDLAEHPRVAFAQAIRADVEVFGDDRGLVTLATGLAGRTELSVELADPHQAGKGVGRGLLRDALGLIAPGEPVFAAVSPGNARSLRAFLAAGFVVIGSECVIERPSLDQ